MNINELKKILACSNISPNMYSLEGGYYDGKYVIEESYNGWEVYYCFCGHKHNVKHYTDESVACLDFYDRVRGYVHRYVCNQSYPSKWRYVTTAIRDVFYVEGETIPLYTLHDSKDEIVLADPYYGQPHRMNMCFVQIKGSEKQFAYGETSSSVFICCINDATVDSPEILFSFFKKTLSYFGTNFLINNTVHLGNLDIDMQSFLGEQTLDMFCEKGWITHGIMKKCLQIKNEISGLSILGSTKQIYSFEKWKILMKSANDIVDYLSAL